MKIQPLYDLQQEINRLFIAGSKFAAADPRLLKHVPVFQKLGEKAPVFKKLAADIETLTQASSQESSEKLLAISTLLYAVLYTQGETLEEGAEIKTQQPVIELEKISTQYSYLQLKPIIDALTINSPGRIELLKEAFQQKIFTDFRTYPHLNKALNDKYAELADYVAQTIIPSIGPAILPFIVNGFALEDKTEQVRRLRILNTLNYDKLPELTGQVLAENLPNLQAEAIRYLAKDSRNLLLITKLADDKNKTVREAAYHALMQYGTKESIEKVKNIYCNGKPNQGVITALASSPLPFFFEEVLGQFNKTLDKLFTLDKNSPDKEITDAVYRVGMELELFKNKDYTEVYHLFERIILDKNINDLLTAKKTLLSNNNMVANIVNSLRTFAQNKVLNFYTQLIPRLQNAEWQTEFHRQYFHTCCAVNYPAAKIYDLFIKTFEKGYINVNDLHYEVYGRGKTHYYHTEAFAEPDRAILDMRWMPPLFALIEKKNTANKWRYDNKTALLLLHAYEPAGSKKLNALLTELTKTVPASEIDFVFPMLIERNVPNGFQLIFDSLSNIKKQSNYYYTNIGKASFWQKFPKEFAKKIRDLYERDKISAFDQIADAIEYH